MKLICSSIPFIMHLKDKRPYSSLEERYIKDSKYPLTYQFLVNLQLDTTSQSHLIIEDIKTPHAKDVIIPINLGSQFENCSRFRRRLLENQHLFQEK